MSYKPIIYIQPIIIYYKYQHGEWDNTGLDDPDGVGGW